MELVATLNHAKVQYERGNYAFAKTHYQPTLTISRKMGFRAKKSTSCPSNLAFAAIAPGELDEAWAATRQAMRESVALGVVPITMYALLLAGLLSVKEGDIPSGLAPLGLVLSQQATDFNDRREIDKALGEEKLDDDEFARGLARGNEFELASVFAELVDGK